MKRSTKITKIDLFKVQGEVWSYSGSVGTGKHLLKKMVWVSEGVWKVSDIHTNADPQVF